MRMDSKNKVQTSMFTKTYGETLEYPEYEYEVEKPRYYKVYAFTEPLDQSRVDKYTRRFGDK